MPKELLVFYDGYCPLCRGSKTAIQKTDWLHKVCFLSFREPNMIENYGLTHQNPEERICSIRLKDGKKFEGIDTILQIAVRVPLYWIFVPFLYSAITLGFGQKVYDYIATRRKVIPVGQCDENGCPVHQQNPNKKRT